VTTTPDPTTSATPLLTLDAEALAAMVWRCAGAASFPYTPTQREAGLSLQRYLDLILPDYEPELAVAREPVTALLRVRLLGGELPG
jgi:hypothetical protein